MPPRTVRPRIIIRNVQFDHNLRSALDERRVVMELFDRVRGGARRAHAPLDQALACHVSLAGRHNVVEVFDRTNGGPLLPIGRSADDTESD
jgi:hypothetical protein